MINKIRQKQKIVYGILAVILVGAGVILGMMVKEATLRQGMDSFEDCVSAGYPVMESYPRQCRTNDGQTFFEQIEEGLPQQPPQDSSLAPVEEDVCGQAKYQEACEARPDCIWIGCPNNVCISK